MTRILLAAALYLATLPVVAQGPCPGGVCPAPVYGAGQQWRPVQAASGAIRRADSRYPWICRVQTIEGGGVMDWGSGALVYEDSRLAYVLTAKHVISHNPQRIVVHFPGGRSFGAAVQEAHHTADAALLRIAPTGIEPAKVRDSAPQAGETLYGAGYGGNGTFRAFSGQASYQWQGELALVGCTNRQGDSGGPILDSRGRFVAVQWGCGGGEVMACRWTPVRDLLARVWDRLFRDVVIEVNNPGPLSPVPSGDGANQDACPDCPEQEPGPAVAGPPGPQGPAGPPGPAVEVDEQAIAQAAAEIVLAGIQNIYVRKDEIHQHIPPLTVVVRDQHGSIIEDTYVIGRDKLILDFTGERVQVSKGDDARSN